jgi:hypothetical protein
MGANRWIAALDEAARRHVPGLSPGPRFVSSRTPKPIYIHDLYRDTELKMASR